MSSDRTRPQGRWLLPALAGATLSTIVAVSLVMTPATLPSPGQTHLPPTEVLLDRRADDFSVLVLDREDRLLRPFLTDAGRWRVPVDLSDIDPTYLEMLIAYEDRRFHDHHGVDPLAVMRAGWQALRHGRIVSGASTLTMQLARLSEPAPVRSIRAKLREMLRAVEIDTTLDKSEILKRYLDLAPFGGNLEGVRAASLAYFGKEPARLTVAEAALLVALPQSPETRRPDRHPEAMRAARNRVLTRMAAAGVISTDDALTAQSEPVPSARQPVPLHAAHLARSLRADDPTARSHRTTLDLDLQRVAEARALAHARRHGRSLSAAALIIDRASGQVLAHIGSADFLDGARRGHVDMTQAVRSPGSALKPFIYGLAFEDVLAHPETLIEDRPTAFGAYEPTNFDDGYHGTVSVREALQLSLNVPAVALLDAVGPLRFRSRLSQAGATLILPNYAVSNLAMALGGLGISLTDLTFLYAGLANDGVPVPLSAKHDGMPVIAAGAPFLPQAIAQTVTAILLETPPPQAASGSGIAYKTGTSYGYRDAWAVGYDRDTVIAVWLGRPDAAPTPGLTGLTAAAPFLFDLFAGLGPRHQPLAPNRDIDGRSNADLPAHLRIFRPGGSLPLADAGATPLRIAFPPDGADILLSEDRDGGYQPFALRAQGGEAPFVWLVNGRPVAANDRRRSAEFRPSGPGYVDATVIDRNGQSARASFRLE